MFSAARVLKGSRTLPTSRLASSTAAAAPPLRRAFTPRRSTAPAAATAFNAPATTTSKVPTAETTRERVEPGPRAPLASPPPRESAAETPASTVEPSNDSLTSYPSPPPPAGGGGGGGPAAAAIDWSTSFHGLSETPFTREQAETLMRPLVPDEIEIKPDGLLYLPEILYRRILNHAFGPGGWGMVPRGELTVLKGLVTREWGLVAGGRYVVFFPDSFFLSLSFARLISPPSPLSSLGW